MRMGCCCEKSSMTESELEESQRRAAALLKRAMRKSLDCGSKRDAYGHLRKHSVKKDRSQKEDSIELIDKQEGSIVELSQSEMV